MTRRVIRCRASQARRRSLSAVDPDSDGRRRSVAMGQKATFGDALHGDSSCAQACGEAGTFVTVSLIFRIVSNLEQSWLRAPVQSCAGRRRLFEAGSRNSAKEPFYNP